MECSLLDLLQMQKHHLHPSACRMDVSDVSACRMDVSDVSASVASPADYIPYFSLPLDHLVSTSIDA